MVKIIFLFLYLAVSAVHLYGCAGKNQTIRNITKPLLMPLLAGFYIFSGAPVSWLVVLLIGTSWLGDILLMIKGMKWFVMGGFSFLATHILLIYLYLPNITWDIQCVTVMILYAILGFGLLRSEYVWLKRYMPKAMIRMMLGYLLGNVTMNLFAALQAVSNLNQGSGLILLGALLFLASDSLLFMVRFNKKLPFYRQHFNVMLTYTLAKLMIVMGFIFAN
ncbi:MAG: lysoplasmalogenase [Lachnospiraceae bacterium]|nr:lysoplasmalogenase [Lachnospiraceae bacterium]